MKEVLIDTYTCLIGKNATENWRILQEAHPNHLFFHLTSFPSCYVILQTEEKVDSAILTRCARVCLENTKLRNAKNIYVDFTPVHNVQKGEQLGEIYYLSSRKVGQIKV